MKLFSKENIKQIFSNKQLIKKILTGLVAVSVVAFAFYWYEVRPMQIKKQCADKARNGLVDSIYRGCLRQNGL